MQASQFTVPSTLTANPIARSLAFLAASTALEVAEFAVFSLNSYLESERSTLKQASPAQPVVTTASIEIASIPAIPPSEPLVNFDHLPSLTIRDLKQLAKEAGLKGYSRMSKAELITALATL